MNLHRPGSLASIETADPDTGRASRFIFLVAAGTILGLVLSIVAVPAQAESLSRDAFWSSFAKRAQPFANATGRQAVESTVRLTWAAPDLGDPLVVRLTSVENPDGSQRFSATGGPIGDVRGVCAASGTCWMSTDGGRTWLSGPRPKGDATTLSDQLAMYDPVYWGASDLPGGASYDVRGRTYTITVDDDSSITVSFSNRRVDVSGELRDEDSTVRVTATHALVPPQQVRPPQ